jgi:hypothetical protein
MKWVRWRVVQATRLQWIHILQHQLFIKSLPYSKGGDRHYSYPYVSHYNEASKTSTTYANISSKTSLIVLFLFFSKVCGIVLGVLFFWAICN